jgi:hypothetical protein
MPELPDVTIYLEALSTRILGQTVEQVRLGSPFLVRTIDPPFQALAGRPVTELRRIGKRIAIAVDGSIWSVGVSIGARPPSGPRRTAAVRSRPGILPRVPSASPKPARRSGPPFTWCRGKRDWPRSIPVDSKS